MIMSFYQKRPFGRTNTITLERKERSKSAPSKVERRKSRALMLFGVSLLFPHPLRLLRGITLWVKGILMKLLSISDFLSQEVVLDQ